MPDKLILTEKRNPDTENLDVMSSLEIAQAMNNEDKKVALAVEKVLPQIAQAIDSIVNAFQANGRLAYFGAGTSGRLGVLDASECPPTFGANPDIVQAFIAGGNQAIRQAVENAEDRIELAQQDIAAFAPTKHDVVVAISASGNPNYCLEALRLAHLAGAKTIAVSSNPEAKMKALADIFINPIVGEEALTGSSRLKSGTAQKMVLNMLSTGAFVRYGKAYKNYMIDVQLNNKKLFDRGCRFVSEIANIPYDKAQTLLSQCGNVKTACVMAAKNCSQQQAEELLLQAKGILRKVL